MTIKNYLSKIFPGLFVSLFIAIVLFNYDHAAETEKLVAGSPKYAFNEYLRIFLEWGVVGGVLFLLTTILIILREIKNNEQLFPMLNHQPRFVFEYAMT
jgi:hypothetical protein